MFKESNKNMIYLFLKAKCKDQDPLKHSINKMLFSLNKENVGTGEQSLNLYKIC